MKRYLLYMLGFMILLTACEIKEPTLPVWFVDLNIPLINDRYYVHDLVDSVHVVVDDNDLLYLVTDGEMGTPEFPTVYINPTVALSDVPIVSGIEVQQDVPFLDSSDDLTLSYGQVAEGEMRVRFSNLDPGVQSISLTIHDIYIPSGAPLIVDSDGSEDWQVIDLAGYHFGVYDSGQELDELSISLTSQSTQPDGSIIGEMSAQLNTPISFSVFQGELGNYEIAANESVSGIEIDYPHGVEEAIQLQEAFVQIDIFNDIGFSCEFSGFMKGTRGDIVEIRPIVDQNGNNFRIRAGSSDAPAHEIINLHDNISQLMQIMPESVEIVDAKFVIDTASGFGTIRNTDAIHGEYRVSVPFHFVINEHTIEVVETQEIQISPDNQDLIRNNLLEADLVLEMQNKIPVGGVARAYFGSTAEIDPDDPLTYGFVKEMSMESSEINEDWQSPVALQLSKSELALFTEPSVFLKLTFSLNATQYPIQIHASDLDYIALKSLIHGKIKVEEI